MGIIFLIFLVGWAFEILITIYYLMKGNLWLKSKKVFIFFVSLLLSLVLYLFFEWLIILIMDKLKVIDTWTDTDRTIGKLYFAFVVIIYILTPLFTTWYLIKMLNKRQLT